MLKDIGSVAALIEAPQHKSSIRKVGAVTLGPVRNLSEDTWSTMFPLLFSLQLASRLCFIEHHK